MGSKITTGMTYKLNQKQAHAARMLAEGKPVKYIAGILFDVRTEDGCTTDEKKLRAAEYQVRKWMKMPHFQECYRAIIRESAFAYFGAAVDKVAQQIHNSNEWLANKAANDIITRFGPEVMGIDDKSVTVRIEGMPELGTPDQTEES